MFKNPSNNKSNKVDSKTSNNDNKINKNNSNKMQRQIQEPDNNQYHAPCDFIQRLKAFN